MKKLLLIPTILLTAFSCTSTTEDNGPVRIGQSKSQTSPADWQITLRVKEKLLSDSSLFVGNRFVSVSTTDGIVTLTGNVSSKDQIKKIVKIVERVQGVTDVNNQLTISKN